MRGRRKHAYKNVQEKFGEKQLKESLFAY